MRHLSFPTDEIVGTLDWLDSWDDEVGPVLATGVVEVPDDVEVDLSVHRVQSVERDPFSGGGFITNRITEEGEVVTEQTSGQGWVLSGGSGPPLHLGFLRELPADSMTSLSMSGSSTVLAESLSALPHLALGLKRLYLGRTDFGDNVLQYVALLENLTYLQTWGNRFTDHGVKQLASLQALETLYLEEENLSPAAFDFVTELPNLTRLGVADEWPAEYLSALRRIFPDVVR
jgi:hypothetical protein